MSRLRVQAIAKRRGVTQTALHLEVNKRMPNEPTPVAMGTIRRYWFGTKDGKEGGPPIKSVDLDLLEAIAETLGVEVCDLLAPAEEKSPGPLTLRPRQAVNLWA